MSNTFFNLIRIFSASSLVLLVLSAFASAATPTVRIASGANAAAIQTAVDQFRADLGTLNPNNGQSFPGGRREVNWDGVPDNFSDPNLFKNDFFNVNSPRGVVFNAIESGNSSNAFLVSADNSNPTNTAVRFGSINPAYSTIFQVFSPQRLFMMKNSTLMETVFFIPGTKIAATVNGFGVIFADVDNSTNATIKLFAPDGSLITALDAPAATDGLSFVGASFTDGTRIARVVIESGKNILAAQNVDGTNGVDVTVMDDFIYGEPRALDFHPGDADGDGVADARVFRPATGEWFTLNSGSNTISIEHFGAYGDIPVEGDFDGDRRADLAIFRPTEGGWYVKRSTDGTFITQAFGATGDKPVAGDYDKDGKTDIAVWRPSNGNYFVLRSSDNQSSFFAFPFGVNGDIPVLAAAQ